MIWPFNKKLKTENESLKLKIEKLSRELERIMIKVQAFKVSGLAIIAILTLASCEPVRDSVGDFEEEETIKESESSTPIDSTVRTVNVNGVDFKIVVIDGCEYLVSEQQVAYTVGINGIKLTTLTHKGDCPNHSHR